MKFDHIDIKTWFPKPIFRAKDILTEELPVFEEKIKNLVAEQFGGKREDLVAVMDWQTISTLHEDPSFKELTEEILLHSKIFLKELGYLHRINTIRIKEMWANINVEGDFLFPHVHPDSLISGVFYIKTYPGSKINFFDNLASMAPQPDIRNDLNWDLCSYECNPGEMLMWKSDFVHGTRKQPTGEKIAISFNLY